MANIIFSEKCLEYGSFHIENPKRVGEAVKILKNKGYEFLEPEPVSEKDVLLVHEESYVEKVKNGKIDDADTPAYDDIYKYARLAAGGAVLAAKRKGFSLMRPPGHHAGKNGRTPGASTQGFCYFNNIAIAVKLLNKKTLILDIDGHHGNGTEEIFKKDKDVTFISLHRKDIYPGTGITSTDNCLNFPLEEDCGEKIYLKTLKNALEKVHLEKIEAIAVSAGFDGYFGDLASLGLTDETFGEIGKILRELKKHTFFVLEGGYLGLNIGRGVNELIKAYAKGK